MKSLLEAVGALQNIVCAARTFGCGFVGVVFAASALAYQEADTDLDACYGETLEVSIVAGAEHERTNFALPNPRSWLVTPRGASDVLQRLPCLPEPIETHKFTGTFVEPRLGQATDLFAAPEGVQMWQLRVFGISDFSESQATLHLNRVLATETAAVEHSGVLYQPAVKINGFLYQRWGNKPPYEGSWVFPEDYRSAVGDRLAGWCGALCTVDTRIKPYLAVRYDVRMPRAYEGNPSGTFDKIPPWIEVDQMVRNVVQSWIVE